MALPDDMEIVKVILPKSYLPKIDALVAPGQRSRSAVIRRMVERMLNIDFFTPQCSVDRPAYSAEDHPAEPVGNAK
jgi:Arc/MetJ-type ribon-helix-helix transcriptional regulator